MITVREGLPSHVVVAEASGDVTADDYEQVLMPAVDAAAAGEAKVRLLYVLGADFDGFEAGAALDDTRLGLRHWSDFEKLGMVTDHTGYRGMVKAISFLLPGETRVFELAEVDDAVAWLLAD